jgi:hypothetical protein
VRFTTLTTILIVAACSTVWLPLSFSIGGLNLRVSQLVLGPVLLILFGQSSWRLTALGATQVVLGTVFVGVLLFWTVWWHDTLPPLSAGRVALHVLNLLHLVALQVLVCRTGELRRAVHTLIATVAAFDGFYVVVALLAAAGVSLPLPILVTASQPTLVGGEIVARTVQRFEGGGIIAGCLSAACLLMLLAMVMDRVERRPRRWWLTAVLLSAGIVLGYSRQSLVGLALGIVVIAIGFALRGQMQHTIRVAGRLIGAGIMSGILLTAIPATRVYVGAFAGRASLLWSGTSYSTGTAAERVQMWSAMWDDITENPLMGRGQDAYLRHYPPTDPSTRDSPGGGAHNFPIEVWHAGGLIAVLAILGFHLLVYWPATVGLLAVPRAYACLTIGLVAGGASVATAALTNLIYWNPTYWLILGLVSAVRVIPLHAAPPSKERAIG